MPRVREIKNLWGTPGGIDPQRSDLWQLDASELVNGLNNNRSIPASVDVLPDLPRYFASAVSLPELRLKAETYRRDSRSYQMPSWDEPLEAIRLTFILDASSTFFVQDTGQPASVIYKILDLWRMVCRAGRGAVTTEQEVLLDANYRIEFRYALYLFLCRGYGLPPAFATGKFGNVTTPGGRNYQVTFDAPLPMEELRQQTQVLASRGQLFQNQINSGLEVSGILRLENCWLGSFKVGDMNYEGARVQTIEANVYTENILLVSKSAEPVTP